MFNSENILQIAPVLGAICGAMLWLTYFVKIDVLEPEKTLDLVFAFCVGFLTPNITLFVYGIFTQIGFDFNNHFWNDLIFSIVGIGLVEELSKLIGVLVVFILIRKSINEPIDYLVYAGIIALGFAIRENYIYFNNYGSHIITGRTLISSLTHIINTSICVYGIYRFKIFNKGYIFINSFFGIFIAIVSHGLFDFFLKQQIIGMFTPFLASGIYLIGINFWIQMFNNCINFSPFFNYDKLRYTSRLYKTIMNWYIALLFIEFFYVWYFKNVQIAFVDVFKNIFNEGVLLVIVSLRASRLKLSKRKYFKIKMQLPFYYTKNDDEDINILGFLPLKIRGESRKEFRFYRYMGKDVFICPLNPEQSSIKTNRKGRFLKKYFLKNEVVAYLIELYENENFKKEIFIMKPKTFGTLFFNARYPIANLFKYDFKQEINEALNPPSYKELEGLESVFIKRI